MLYIPNGDKLYPLVHASQGNGYQIADDDMKEHYRSYKTGLSFPITYDFEIPDVTPSLETLEVLLQMIMNDR